MQVITPKILHILECKSNPTKNQSVNRLRPIAPNGLDVFPPPRPIVLSQPLSDQHPCHATRPAHRRSDAILVMGRAQRLGDFVKGFAPKRIELATGRVVRLNIYASAFDAAIQGRARLDVDPRLASFAISREKMRPRRQGGFAGFMPVSCY